MSLYEQDRQILQVNLDVFGELPQPQPATVASDHAVVLAAVKFMTKYADKYSKGEYESQKDMRKHKTEEVSKAS